MSFVPAHKMACRFCRFGLGAQNWRREYHPGLLVARITNSIQAGLSQKRDFLSQYLKMSGLAKLQVQLNPGAQGQ